MGRCGLHPWRGQRAPPWTWRVQCCDQVPVSKASAVGPAPASPRFAAHQLTSAVSSRTSVLRQLNPLPGTMLRPEGRLVWRDVNFPRVALERGSEGDVKLGRNLASEAACVRTGGVVTFANCPPSARVIPEMPGNKFPSRSLTGVLDEGALMGTSSLAVGPCPCRI